MAIAGSAAALAIASQGGRPLPVLLGSSGVGLDGRRIRLDDSPAGACLRRRILPSPLPRALLNGAVLRSEFAGDFEQRRKLGGRGGRVRGRAGYARPRRRAGEARAGLPVVSGVPVLGPVLNAVFNPLVLFILYAAGARRFWGGFGRTSYDSAKPTKIALTALWPVLFIASGAYRSNFKKAVR